MNIALIVLQILVSITLIILIAVQGKGGGLGSTFGGSISSFSKRRGVEKFIFSLTIGTAGAFLVLSILNLLI